MTLLFRVQGLVGITPNGMRALELIDPRLKTYLFEKGKYNTEAFTKTIDTEGSTERTVTFEVRHLTQLERHIADA